MATRGSLSLGKNLSEPCTPFQLHKSQISAVQLRNVFDWSEFKLKNLIENSNEEKVKDEMQLLLSLYKKGKVAIAWRAGKPVWINVTSGS